MKTIIGAMALGLLLSSPSQACTEDGREGFMPENDMRISVDSKFANDMTEARFNEIIDRVADVYAPVVAKRLGKLVVARKWSNDTVNASAQRLGPLYLVNMYGGLARHPDVTDDAFALVVCHELGHHLGGAPKIAGFGSKWASNEGQSDYFGTLKCFRNVFGGDDNIGIVAGMQIDADATTKCQEAWGNAEDVALCQRSAMAGKSLAILLGGGRSAINFATPDSSVVSRTNDRHPAAQCRLDTYFQGSLCEKSQSENVSDKDPNVGTCATANGHTEGVRPLCWYKP
jgi:hypothetical protein